MTDKVTLHAMYIDELKKMISEGNLTPICYFCKDDEVTILSFDEISCIFKKDGQLCFACNSHYGNALDDKREGELAK